MKPCPRAARVEQETAPEWPPVVSSRLDVEGRRQRGLLNRACSHTKKLLHSCLCMSSKQCIFLAYLMESRLMTAWKEANFQISLCCPWAKHSGMWRFLPPVVGTIYHAAMTWSENRNMFVLSTPAWWLYAQHNYSADRCLRYKQLTLVWLLSLFKSPKFI